MLVSDLCEFIYLINIGRARDSLREFIPWQKLSNVGVGATTGSGEEAISQRCHDYVLDGGVRQRGRSFFSRLHRSHPPCRH